MRFFEHQSQARQQTRRLLLVSPSSGAPWLDAHPPLAERICRIYGRPMKQLDPYPQHLAATRNETL